MTCENLFNKACEEKIQGHTEKAYELFSEVVNQFPGTDSAIYASEEMKELSVANTTEYSYIPSYIEDEIEKSDRLYEKACAEKAKGNLEKAYEIFAEIVNSYPGTVSRRNARIWNAWRRPSISARVRSAEEQPLMWLTWTALTMFSSFRTAE